MFFFFKYLFFFLLLISYKPLSPQFCQKNKWLALSDVCVLQGSQGRDVLPAQAKCWGGPQGFLTTGRAARRGSNTHHPRRLLQALQSEHPLMYQDGWCSWISYQKYQTWPCNVAVSIAADWVLLGPQEASVFLQTLLSTSSVGHCVLL